MTQAGVSNFADENITLREKIAYGLGDFGSNLYLCVGTLYLLKFYTDELQISAAYGGIIFLISKFFTAFTDIFTGIVLDSRKHIGRMGKFRPFMLYGSFICIFITTAQFIDTPFSQPVQIIFSTVFFMLFGLCYSMFNCAYGSVLGALTKDPDQRASFASFRQGGSTLGLMTCTVAFIPIASLFETYGSASYTIAAAIFSVCGFICMVFCFANIKERYIVLPDPNANAGIIKSLLGLFDNRPLLVLALINLCTLGAFNIKLAIQVYFCTYVLKDTTLLSYMGFFSMGCVLLGVLIVPTAVSKFGKKKVYLFGLCLWVIGDLLNFMFSHDSVMFVLFSCVAFFGTSFANTLNWVCVIDTTEYGEWKTGIRSEGTVYTGYTFSRKISAAMAGFLPGILLAYVGYVPNVEQTADTILGIRFLIFGVPGFFAALAAALMFFFYNLDDKLFNKIVMELKERRANKQQVSESQEA